MCNKIIIFLFCVVFWISVSAIKDLPDHFPRCSRSDPTFQECLLKATEEVRPYIRKGIPDFLPSIEKFVIPEISLQQGNRAVNYEATFRNVTMYGLDLYEFTRYEFVASNLTFLIEVKLPYLFIESKYWIDGKILMAPIKGDGNFRINITDTNCFIHHEDEIVKKNGVDYLKPTVTISKIDVGTVIDYTFDGLFKDNPQLAEATNKVIQDNLGVLIEELTPAIEKVLTAMFDEIISKPVTQIPYDKLYPK